MQTNAGQMVKTLKRLALGVIGALGLLTAVVRKGRIKSKPDALRLLRYLSKDKSSSVRELSSKMKLSIDETARLLGDLEERGWVQLSGDQGAGHVRIAAITQAGREQIADGQSGA
jgi:DNA-binding MarR family transcriptional regulator